MTRHHFNLIVALAISLTAVGTSHAINIVLEYPAGTLFHANLDFAAKNAISAAAADISAAITSTLSANSNDVIVGSNGNPATTATFNMYYAIPNPSGSGQVQIDPATFLANTVTMRVGTKSLTGSTLGEGGPAGMGYSASFSGFSGQFVGAVDDAETKLQNAFRRVGGPIVDTISGSATLGSTTANFSFDFGIAYGGISFDSDSENQAALNNYWHFNHLTAVAAGKNDLYSVAVHEILHALGIGSTDSWNLKRSGTTWTGSEVVNLYGTGANLVTSDHVAEGIMSTSIVNGAPQEVVMDPTVTTGTRKHLTALDLAFLRDIGYSTIIPQIFSPADFDEDGDVDSADLLTWRNAYGANANGDTDNDNDTDGRDFLRWQREFTGSSLSASGTAVPEPGLATVAITALLCLSCTRRR